MFVADRRIRFFGKMLMFLTVLQFVVVTVIIWAPESARRITSMIFKSGRQDNLLSMLAEQYYLTTGTPSAVSEDLTHQVLKFKQVTSFSSTDLVVVMAWDDPDISVNFCAPFGPVAKNAYPYSIQRQFGPIPEGVKFTPVFSVKFDARNLFKGNDRAVEPLVNQFLALPGMQPNAKAAELTKLFIQGDSVYCSQRSWRLAFWLFVEAVINVCFLFLFGRLGYSRANSYFLQHSFATALPEYREAIPRLSFWGFLLASTSEEYLEDCMLVVKTQYQALREQQISERKASALQKRRGRSTVVVVLSLEDKVWALENKFHSLREGCRPDAEAANAYNEALQKWSQRRFKETRSCLTRAIELQKQANKRVILVSAATNAG